MKSVEIFTDGGCRGNPGIGGWGALLVAGSHTRELSGSELDSTNNRMELIAAIEGLKALNRPCSVTVVTDSQYVKNGITQWIIKWKKNNWKTSSRKPVKNQDLWLELDEIVQRHDVSWDWVRGHAGHPENERVDQLANEAMDQLQEQ